MCSFKLLFLLLVSVHLIRGELGDYFVSAKGQFPFFAYCFFEGANIAKILRQGTLISSRNIILNANYIFGVQLSRVTCILGAQNVSESEAFQQSFDIPIDNVKFHEGFSKDNEYLNSIVLILLPKSVDINEYVQPAKLPSIEGMFIDDEVFGVTRDKHVGIVVYSKLPVLDNERCKQIWADIDESNICIPSRSSNHFFMRNPDRTWIFIAMKLFRPDPEIWRNKLDPHLGIRLDYYLNWIYDNIYTSEEDYYDDE